MDSGARAVKRLILVAFLLGGPAYAQQASVDDVRADRNQYMGAFAQCDTASIVLRQQVAKLQAENAELKAAAEKKPEIPPAQ